MGGKKGGRVRGRKGGREERRKGGKEEGRKGGREEGGKGGRSKFNVKVNYHHYVLRVGHLGNFLHVPRVGHLAQCYCFLSILYNWANATGGEENRRL